MHNNNFTPDTTRWSLWQMEQAEYDCGTAPEFEWSYAGITDAIMDDTQGAIGSRECNISYEDHDYEPDMMTRKEPNYLEWLKELHRA